MVRRRFMTHGGTLIALILLAGPLLIASPGCGGGDDPQVSSQSPYAGLYLGLADLNDSINGSLELNVDFQGKATGSFRLIDVATGSGSKPPPFPHGIFPVSGSANMSNGQFSVSGTGIELNGASFPIEITGTLTGSSSGSTWSVQAGQYSGSGTMTYFPPGGVTVGAGTTGG
ncbi:MAG: hypothetical protein KY468_04135 [Armatimonadetes bacterium]|nr:hypothetical protein [Armatimonadota bacterium]